MLKTAWYIIAAALASGVALSQDAKPAAAEERTTFETVCGACHDSSMASELRAEADWKDTIAVMIKTGAKGSPEQFELVLRYLLHNLTKVNVNTAPPAEIEPVLAVSTATAQAIVRRRTEKGAFQSLDELKRMPGVDAELLESRKDRIVF
jgi:competence protein ComEA